MVKTLFLLILFTGMCVLEDVIDNLYSDSHSLFTKFYKESGSKSGKHINISKRQQH